jgi:hypothetical protein
MFAQGPPPPSVPCIKQTGPNVTYTLVTSIEQLCAPAPGSNVSHVVYSGSICDAEKKKILWESMRTLDPRKGTSECSWSRTEDPRDIPGYLGDCGVAPMDVVLPIAVC